MPSISKRSHRSHAQWQALIERAEHSELSVTEFCRRESVSTASFYTWRNRLRPDPELQSPPVAADFIDLGTLAEAKDCTTPSRSRVYIAQFWCGSPACSPEACGGQP